MWDRRTALCAALVFALLCYSVPAEEMGMAATAVDYMYESCRKDAMEMFVHSGLLQQEVNVSTQMQKVWSDATQCSMMIPGGTQEHVAALYTYAKAYANADEHFLSAFNDQVATKGGNDTTYQNDFRFKSLHFLLMDYMALQTPLPCKRVYILPEEEVTARKGSAVRLGRFMMAQTSFAALKKRADLYDRVILNVTSCFFAKLGGNICKIEEDIVLLSPAEVFAVESVNARDEDDTTFTEIVLRSVNVTGSEGCGLISRSLAVVPTQWLMLVLLPLSLFWFPC